MRHSRFFIPWLAILFANLPATAAPPLFVGVLEAEPSHAPAVRLAFRKTANGWAAMPSHCPDMTCLEHIAAQYPRRIDWTIAFDGHRLGTVVAQTPARYEAYGDVGQQPVAQPQTAPHAGAPSGKFAGWTGETVRPQVAISQPNTTDPDGWKPARLDGRAAAILHRAFRGSFPHETNCRDPIQNESHPWAYRDADIRITGTYADRRGWRIANLVLAPDRCDGPSESGFESQTFVLSPGGKATLLDRGLMLVDAGDYDGDGRSELVFQVARYNRGGYAMVYDDFRRKTSFIFSYH